MTLHWVIKTFICGLPSITNKGLTFSILFALNAGLNPKKKYKTSKGNTDITSSC